MEIGLYMVKKVFINNVICCKRRKYYLLFLLFFFFIIIVFMGFFFCCENSMIDCVGSIYFKLKNILLNCNI